MFDNTFLNLEKGMKTAAARQSVISHNIANRDTPNYEAMEFDEELGLAVKRVDKKKVVIEEEMAALSENSIKYSAYVKLLTSKLNILRTIATQGRR